MTPFLRRNHYTSQERCVRFPERGEADMAQTIIRFYDGALIDSTHDKSEVAAKLTKQALSIVKRHGPLITYSGLFIDGYGGCAMSSHTSKSGDTIIEIDSIGTLIRGRDVVKFKKY